MLKSIFVNAKILTILSYKNKIYLRIYKDSFGVNILRDDCAPDCIAVPVLSWTITSYWSLEVFLEQLLNLLVVFLMKINWKLFLDQGSNHLFSSGRPCQNQTESFHLDLIGTFPWRNFKIKNPKGNLTNDLTDHFLHGNIQLRHLRNAKPLL